MNSPANKMAGLKLLGLFVLAQFAASAATTCTANAVYTNNLPIVRSESASAAVGDIEVQCTGGSEVAGTAPMQMAQITVTSSAPFAPRLLETYTGAFSYTLTDTVALATTGAVAYPTNAAATTVNCFTAKDAAAGTSGKNICANSQTIANGNGATNAYDGTAGHENVFHARLDTLNPNRLTIVLPLAQVTGLATKIKIMNIRVTPPAGGLDAGSNVTFVAGITTGVVQDLSIGNTAPNRFLYLGTADVATTTTNPLLAVSAVGTGGSIGLQTTPTVCEPNTLGASGTALSLWENPNFLNGFDAAATADDGSFKPVNTSGITPAFIGVMGAGVGTRQRFAVTFTNVPVGVSVALPRYAEVSKVTGAGIPTAAGTSYGNKVYVRLLATSYLTAGGADDPLQAPPSKWVDLPGYATAAAYQAGLTPASVPTTTILSQTDSVRTVTAFYEVEPNPTGPTSLDNAARDYFSIVPRITYTAAVDTTVQATASIGLAPTAVSGPRFNGVPSASGNWLKAADCSCTVLFPYVTDKAGYDTGLAMANTSRRVTTVLPGATIATGVAPFNNSAESTGPVTARFFPIGAGTVTTAVTTKALKAGDTLTYIISQGNAEYGLPAVPDFTGYVAMTGSFNYCHGFGYMSAAGAGPTSNGMSVSITPLVMGAGVRAATESLGH